jgi:hypothetical protein
MTKRNWLSIMLVLSVLLPIQLSTGTANALSIQNAKDPTRNLSEEERKKISFKVWVNSPTAKFLKQKESNNNCKATGSNGKYQGTWQMSAGFWKTYGGKKYASKASKATCKQQDLVAYKGWLDRGWSPWPPAKNFKP